MAYGTPVEPALIDKTLKRLWAESDNVSTRASLMNLAIYSEDPDGLDTGSALISELTRTHACRAILINARPGAEGSRVRSWINVHCHTTRAGAKQVCCEQLSFLLEGGATQRIPNIVFSHLDSDLPLTFCWLGNLHTFTDQRFWTWVDKLIVDSLNWTDPKKELALLQDILKSAPRLCMRDINWMRSVYLRGALTQALDHPAALALLENLGEIEIHHTAERRLTALLVLGWMWVRLGWKEVRRDGSNFIGTTGGETPREFKITLKPAAGEGFTLLALRDAAGEGEVLITREQGAAHYRARTRLPGEGTTERLTPAGTRGVPALINEELSRGSRSRNCEITLQRVLELL